MPKPAPVSCKKQLVPCVHKTKTLLCQGEKRIPLERPKVKWKRKADLFFQKVGKCLWRKNMETQKPAWGALAEIVARTTDVPFLEDDPPFWFWCDRCCNLMWLWWLHSDFDSSPLLWPFPSSFGESWCTSIPFDTPVIPSFNWPNLWSNFGISLHPPVPPSSICSYSSFWSNSHFTISAF